MTGTAGMKWNGWDPNRALRRTLQRGGPRIHAIVRQDHWGAQGRLKRERPARESHVRHVDAPFKATDTDVVLCRHAEHHFEGAPSEHVGRDVLADAALRRFTETFHLLLERELPSVEYSRMSTGSEAPGVQE